MEQQKKHTPNKGGRPKKASKRDQLLGIKWTQVERKAIEAKAARSQTTVSDYLRQSGLARKIVSRQKKLPPEVLQLTGMLHHLAANLNQIARKRNSMEQLNAFERADLELQSRALKTLADTIKKYVQ